MTGNIEQQRSIWRAVAFLLSCFVVANLSVSETAAQQIPPIVEEPNHSAAESMVNAMQRYKPMQPVIAMSELGFRSPDGPENQANNALNDAIRRRYKSQYQGDRLFQIMMVGMSYFSARINGIPGTDLSVYKVRFESLEDGDVSVWASEYRPSDKALLLLSIVFFDYIWDGPNLDRGKQQIVINRISSLPASAIDIWATATETKETPFVAAYSLATVPELFPSDKYSESAFNAAIGPAIALYKSAGTPNPEVPGAPRN